MNKKTKIVVGVLTGIAVLITVVGTWNFYNYLAN